MAEEVVAEVTTERKVFPTEAEAAVDSKEEGELTIVPAFFVKNNIFFLIVPSGRIRPPTRGFCTGLSSPASPCAPTVFAQVTSSPTVRVKTQLLAALVDQESTSLFVFLPMIVSKERIGMEPNPETPMLMSPPTLSWSMVANLELPFFQSNPLKSKEEIRIGN